MKFFYVKDHRKKYRYFSSEPVHKPQVEFSRWEDLWELAKKKLMLLPKRILSQEQAFNRAILIRNNEVSIHCSGRYDQKKMHRKFFFFLQRQRSRHVIFLGVETLLLPISGLMALIPGPNVFFGVLALIMITQWQALKGVNRLLKMKFRFIPTKLLDTWETALDKEDTNAFEKILFELEKEFELRDIRKILWK
jgi:hypothetical protein